MSMQRSTNVHEIDEGTTDRKPEGYGFIVVLACAGILLAIASAIFGPPIGSDAMSSGTWLVGP